MGLVDGDVPEPTIETVEEKGQHITNSLQLLQTYSDHAVSDAKHGSVDLLKVLKLQSDVRDQINEALNLFSNNR